MTNDEMKTEIDRLTLSVTTLQVERRTWQIAVMSLIASHPRRDDCLFLMNHYLEAHLQASDTGQVLPENVKSHMRSFLGSLQDASDAQTPEQVQELREQAFPWLRRG